MEGELEQIEIGGLNRLQERYVRTRLREPKATRLERATKTPLNQRQLETVLQLLQLDPLIEQVNAELVAGSTPGRNILLVSLREAPAFRGAIEVDNY